MVKGIMVSGFMMSGAMVRCALGSVPGKEDLGVRSWELGLVVNLKCYREYQW